MRAVDLFRPRSAPLQGALLTRGLRRCLGLCLGLCLVIVLGAAAVNAAGPTGSLKDLGGRTWAGTTAVGPVMLHLSKGKIWLELRREGGNTLCQQEVSQGLSSLELPCRFGGREGTVRFLERGRQVVVSLSGDLDAEMPRQFTLDRAAPIELALGTFRTKSGTATAETTHLGWLKAMELVARRAADSDGLSAAHAAGRALRVDPETMAWSVASEVADQLHALQLMAGTHSLKHGAVDVSGEVPEIVRLALLADRSLPAPTDLGKAPADAVVGTSGVVSRVLRAGKATSSPGPRADANDRILGRYTAWTLDGELVDASSHTLLGRQRLGPATSTAWIQDEAQLLAVGEVRRFWVPRARDNHVAGVVIYDVEVTGIEGVPNVPPPPPDVAAPGGDVQRTDSGIASKVLKRGTGKHKPAWGDNVSLRHTCWTPAGALLDANVDLREPMTMSLQYTLTGLGEIVVQMVTGEQRRVWLPPEFPVANRGNLRWMNVARVCDIELVTSGADGRRRHAAPAEITKAEGGSGIACKTLTPGTGQRHPRATDEVTVRYRGWTAAGEMFVNREALPASSLVEQLPEWRSSPGWSQAVQGMVEGERTRCWIPGRLSAHELLGTLAAPTVVEIALEKINAPLTP